MKIAGVTDVVVVPKGSAKLGLGPPLETIIPVDANRRQIAQFSSRNCKQYGIVRSNLAFILSSQIQTSRNDSNFSKEAGWNEILLWLDALRSQPGAVLKKERANGTCKWVHEKGSYEKWRISEGSDRLWLIGKPGVGKSQDRLIKLYFRNTEIPKRQGSLYYTLSLISIIE
ncbi:uncharacterized protein K444DRAFT_367440 [Hyaloscypha bicolor E]|uniref:Nephrocystin 3-like N-terminal domain-containing protein n=1 Tax=Hyaloscypha bicolor E TaxID=1095630 RepID=A0A2J6TE63_9HELO|nr:uncharacterized protein K444DRAFT_367440 [Hyaloscypha bicolor E]PMD61310.1 hypothetical protein K444DRAFT_367440 [Hyaloscypha bicolor E]